MQHLYNGFATDKYLDAWAAWVVSKGKIGTELADLHAKYGPIVRIGPNVVSIRDSKAIESIYSIKTDFPKVYGSHSHSRRPVTDTWHQTEQMRAWESVKDGKKLVSIAAERDKKVHARMRKPVAGAYSMTSLATLEPFVNQTIGYFIKRLDEEFISKNKQCDIDNWLQYCPYFFILVEGHYLCCTVAYDTVGELSFGRRLGFLEAGGDVDGSLKDLTDEFDYRAIVSLLPYAPRTPTTFSLPTHVSFGNSHSPRQVQNIPWLDWWLRKNPIALSFTKTSSFALRAGSILKQRLGSGAPDPNRKDMLSHFVEAQKAHPEIVDQDMLTGYIMTPLLAGSDTTALVMRSVFYYLLRNRQCLAKLLAESEAAGYSLPPSWKQTQQLPYLEAVVREAMRMNPVGAFNLNRLVPPQGMTLPDGRELPGGVIVGCPISLGGMDPDVVGEAVESFNPERWLQAKDESEERFHQRLGAMNRVDLGWGGGTRKCLGKNIAMLEMCKFIPTVFLLFDVSVYLKVFMLHERKAMTDR